MTYLSQQKMQMKQQTDQSSQLNRIIIYNNNNNLLTYSAPVTWCSRVEIDYY